MSISDSAKLSKDWVCDPQIAKLVRDKAYELAKSPGFSRSDRPDIEQDLTFHLLRKSALFDPARAKPMTFASRLIENKAASMVRKIGAMKCTCRRNALSLNETVKDGEGRTIELAQTFEESAGRQHTGPRRRNEVDLAQLRLDLAQANETLPPRLRDMAARMCHVSQFAAAEVLGISRRQAAKHVAALRELYEIRGVGA